VEANGALSPAQAETERPDPPVSVFAEKLKQAWRG